MRRYRRSAKSEKAQKPGNAEAHERKCHTAQEANDRNSKEHSAIVRHPETERDSLAQQDESSCAIERDGPGRRLSSILQSAYARRPTLL